MLSMLFCTPSERWTDFRRGGANCVIAILLEQATTAKINTFLDRAVSVPRGDGKGLSLSRCLIRHYGRYKIRPR